MSEDSIYELEEMVNQPGTYINPQTEVVVTVDDSTSLDQEVFESEAFEGADWVRISDETPMDEQRRDELMEAFQARHHPESDSTMSPSALEEEDLDEVDDEDEERPGVHEVSEEDEA